MRHDNPTDTTSCPSSDPDVRASSATLAWGWMLALVILMVSTSLAVASVSQWLVPPYFLMMVWLLYPGRSPRETAPACSEGEASAEGSATLERPEPTPAEIDLRSPPGADLPVPAMDTDPEAVQTEKAPEPAAVKTAKRGKGRGRKAKAAAVIEPPEGATWIRVGPGKFVRADGPTAAESSLATTEAGSETEPATLPIVPTSSADDVRIESTPTFDLPVEVAESVESLNEAIDAPPGATIVEESIEPVESLSVNCEGVEAIADPLEFTAVAPEGPVEDLNELVNAPEGDLNHEFSSSSVGEFNESVYDEAGDLSEVSSPSVDELDEPVYDDAGDLSEVSASRVDELNEPAHDDADDLKEVSPSSVDELIEANAEPAFDNPEGAEFEEPVSYDPPATAWDEASATYQYEEGGEAEFADDVEETAYVDPSLTFESHHDDRSAADAAHGTWSAYDPGVETLEDAGGAADPADNFPTPYEAEAESRDLDEYDEVAWDKDNASEAYAAESDIEAEADSNAFAGGLEEDRQQPDVLPDPMPSLPSSGASSSSWRGGWSHDLVAAVRAPSGASMGRFNRPGRQQVRVAPGYRRHSKRSMGRARQVCRALPPRSPPRSGSAPSTRGAAARLRRWPRPSGRTSPR
ncbi:hypothetical protein [Singulisphaera sp. PoT]|uniref:hypothetical protein n=1 Tax=Singulisphaera sp. PoT TaxID=3411797 RepID=UPI003BF47CD1